MADHERVAPEVAEAEFKRFLDAMYLDGEEDQDNEKDRDGFRKQKKTCIKALCAGHLVIDDKGQPVYTPQVGDGGPITFFEPRGKNIMAADKHGTDRQIEQMHAIIASMTKQSKNVIGDLFNRDYQVVQAIAFLFLA